MTSPSSVQKSQEAAELAGGGPWDELVPLGAMTKLPAFPVDTLPAFMADMATAMATELQVPVDLPASLSMGAISAAAGGRIEVRVRGQWREPTNLFLALALPPGGGKSPSFRAMNAPVFKAEKQLQEVMRQMIDDAVTARETAIAQAQDMRHKAKGGDVAAAVKALAEAEAMTVPVMPRLTVDDITPEQAGTIMSEQDGRLAVMSAEGTFFSILMGRYSSGTPNLELVLKAHAGDRVQVDRRGRSELIERPAMTIMTTVQPQVLRELAQKQGMRERGLIARFLLAIPRDLVGNRDVEPALAPQDTINTYNQTMTDLITRIAGQADPVVINLTPAALKRLTDFRRELEPRLRTGAGDLEALRDWAAKLPGATVRIAGLLHLAEHPVDGPRFPVGEETMERAIRQAGYWTEHAMAAFGAMRQAQGTEDAREILNWLGSRLGSRTEFTKRDIYASMHRRFETSTSVDAPLALLEDHGYIRRAPAEEGAARRGRPKVVYQVRPEVQKR